MARTCCGDQTNYWLIGLHILAAQALSRKVITHRELNYSSFKELTLENRSWKGSYIEYKSMNLYWLKIQILLDFLILFIH